MATRRDFYVVGIGASAGGLDAVQQFFNHIPEKPGIAFIVVQHLSPDFKSLMPELLSKHTKLSIFTAADNQVIKPNCIYLNQRNKNLIIRDKKLILMDKAPKDHLNLPIDILFHSLGEIYKDRSIGVILSGTGSDGSRGIKTIKEAGGTILVQEPDTAQFNGMPNSAIYTNLPDFVLPPQGIAERIIQFTQNRLEIKPVISSEIETDSIFKSILTEIHQFSGVNFKNYKNNTLLRRLEKRMNLHNFTSLSEYYQFLLSNDKEKSALKQEFLIGVTSFFRDKEAFQILRSQVIPVICQVKKKPEVIRIWIPGCSSGEEAYSIAILFDRFIRDTKLSLDFKIFATDIDKNALHRASLGNYPVNNFAEIDHEFLDDYFFKTGEQIQIIKRIREKIIFSHHDVTTDPPFIRVDLISCRNLLIYFTNSTQKHVLQNFQYALNKNGFLFLGSSESLGTVSPQFRILDSRWKIFQNINENFRGVIRNQLEDNQTIERISSIVESVPAELRKRSIQTFSETNYYKLLSQKHAPVSLFVNREFKVLFKFGDFKPWLSQRDGMFENNLFQMVNSELAAVLRSGILNSEKERKSISIESFVCNVDSEKIVTDLYFEWLTGLDPSEHICLIQFGKGEIRKAEEQIILKESDLSHFSQQRISELEYELKEKETELQNVIEELETSNEELQSSNEELMSSNEELQSSNEELQSVNEELYTVNTEFQEKNKELESLNNDVNNLLNSTDIGTLFLDIDLNIRKFTPEISRVFHLNETDIGRSITSFASSFPDDIRLAIIHDSREALERLVSFEREIQDGHGRWYIIRIKPFITSAKMIEGVLITLVDTTTLRQTKSELIETEHRLSLALKAGGMAWWEVELPSGSVTFNKNKTEMLGLKAEDFKHYQDFMKYVHPDDYEKTMAAFRDHLTGKRPVYECQYRIKNVHGQYQWFQDIGKIVSSSGDHKIIAGIVSEISSKKQAELSLLEAIKKADVANMYKNQFLANMSHELRTPMNGLIGFASLLKDPTLDPETRNKYIHIIETSSNQLLKLINDIIEVSKIEAGELGIQLIPCHLAKLFTDIESTFDQLKKIRNKEHITIKTVIPPEDSELVIKTDPARLQQVMDNLIGNSLKFTNEGSIEFGFKREQKWIRIYVKDTGIGMPPDKLDIIFERFQRLEQDNKVKYDGTGLGLAITKGIINLLGGSIQVDSDLNKGSVFTFRIPYEKIKVSEETVNDSGKKADYLKMNDLNLLIAEDEIVNLLYLKEIFKEIPMRIVWAENGREAIKKYKELKPDIVLMDLRMPVMDGFEAAREILAFDPGARIIAQTAYAMTSDKEKCLELGFCDYIAKPLNKDSLLDIIRNWTYR